MLREPYKPQTTSATAYLEHVDGGQAQHRPADRPMIPAPGCSPGGLLAWSEDVREHLANRQTYS